MLKEMALPHHKSPSPVSPPAITDKIHRKDHSGNNCGIARIGKIKRHQLITCRDYGFSSAGLQDFIAYLLFLLAQDLYVSGLPEFN
jgi:hypothetical protein